MQTRYSWLQHQALDKRLNLRNFKGDKNASDLLTKILSKEIIRRHMKALGYVFMSGYATVAKKLKPWKCRGRGLVAGSPPVDKGMMGTVAVHLACAEIEEPSSQAYHHLLIVLSGWASPDSIWPVAKGWLILGHWILNSFLNPKLVDTVLTCDMYTIYGSKTVAIVKECWFVNRNWIYTTHWEGNRLHFYKSPLSWFSTFFATVRAFAFPMVLIEPQLRCLLQSKVECFYKGLMGTELQNVSQTDLKAFNFSTSRVMKIYPVYAVVVKAPIRCRQSRASKDKARQWSEYTVHCKYLFQ